MVSCGCVPNAVSLPFCAPICGAGGAGTSACNTKVVLNTAMNAYIECGQLHQALSPTLCIYKELDSICKAPVALGMRLASLASMAVEAASLFGAMLPRFAVRPDLESQPGRKCST